MRRSRWRSSLNKVRIPTGNHTGFALRILWSHNLRTGGSVHIFQAILDHWDSKRHHRGEWWYGTVYVELLYKKLIYLINNDGMSLRSPVSIEQTFQLPVTRGPVCLFQGASSFRAFLRQEWYQTSPVFAYKLSLHHRHRHQWSAYLCFLQDEALSIRLTSATSMRCRNGSFALKFSFLSVQSLASPYI